MTKEPISLRARPPADPFWNDFKKYFKE